MGQTSIEYVTHSWNPIVGCSHAGSPGCDNCYAARLAATRLKHHPLYKGLAEIKNGMARWTGEVRLNEKALEEPLKARKPRRYLVCSMGDLFHEDVLRPFVFEILNIMQTCNNHFFLVLTKRPTLMGDIMQDWFRPYKSEGLSINQVLPNVWPGVTVENEDQLWRIEVLREIPAAGRWVSLEPCLGPIELRPYIPIGLAPVGESPDAAKYGALYEYDFATLEPKPTLGLVVLGGETGPKARPMHPDWARKARNDCMAAGVPFFFKQWGEWFPAPDWPDQQQVPWLGKRSLWVDIRGRAYNEYSAMMHNPEKLCRIGKKAAGHLLDGKEWNQLPEALLLPDEAAST